VLLLAMVLFILQRNALTTNTDAGMELVFPAVNIATEWGTALMTATKWNAVS